MDMFGNRRKRRRRHRRSRAARVGAGVIGGLLAGATAVTVVWRRRAPTGASDETDDPGR